VGDRERANRCDYFAIADATAMAGNGGQRAKDALDDLFKKS